MACQAPLSMGSSRLAYWSGLRCPPPEDLPDPWIESMSLKSPALEVGFFTTSATAEAMWVVTVVESLSHIRLCNIVDCSTPGFPVLPYLLEFVQTHVHCLGDAIQPSHPLLPSSALNLSQYQGLFQWVSSSHQVAKMLELELQHQSF